MMRLPYAVLLNALRSLEIDGIPVFFESYEIVVGAADDFTSPAGDEFGMAKFRAVYIAQPRTGSHGSFTTKLNKVNKKDIGGVRLYSWREISQNSDVMYFASSLEDGAVLLSNDEASLLRSIKQLGERDSVCTISFEKLADKPYWLLREKRKVGSIPLGEASFQEHVEWLSLTIDRSRNAVIDIHGKFASGSAAPKIGDSLIFHPVDSGYVATISSLATPGPNLWALILTLFGFAIYS